MTEKILTYYHGKQKEVQLKTDSQYKDITNNQDIHFYQNNSFKNPDDFINFEEGAVTLIDSKISLQDKISEIFGPEFNQKYVTISLKITKKKEVETPISDLLSVKRDAKMITENATFDISLDPNKIPKRC